MILKQFSPKLISKVLDKMYECILAGASSGIVHDENLELIISWQILKKRMNKRDKSK